MVDVGVEADIQLWNSFYLNPINLRACVRSWYSKLTSLVKFYFGISNPTDQRRYDAGLWNGHKLFLHIYLSQQVYHCKCCVHDTAVKQFGKRGGGCKWKMTWWTWPCFMILDYFILYNFSRRVLILLMRGRDTDHRGWIHMDTEETRRRRRRRFLQFHSKVPIPTFISVLWAFLSFFSSWGNVILLYKVRAFLDIYAYACACELWMHGVVGD